ncbi:ribosome recycling factor domain-containing protein [Crucibulum laeve]|uniref:Ribosome recycling factor domain-containing protein n=1 Tax=Crucibulum laeve TaxID=68775 RepID=A0A5C3M2C7_9AGAR|nr:ribosome recycling factor domain-containing protein [Crucibulum laeve]
MSLLRLALRAQRPLARSGTISQCLASGCNTSLHMYYALPTRGYATKKAKGGKEKASKEKEREKDTSYTSPKGKVSTASLVPGSKQPITDPVAQQEYAKAEAAMQTAVEWYRKECAAIETRASGRVTPAMLAPVRIKLPNDDKEYKLDEVATVGVRDGSTLLVTLFDENTVKYVEQGLYDSNIPGVVPHKQDNRTIKVPIPKPTVEARNALFTSAKRKAEDMRVQIRKQHQTSLKRGKYEKHSVEIEEFQKLTDRYVAEVDKIIADLQKATSAK